jgi:hypothetical protein
MLESNQTAFSTVSMEAIHSAAAKLGAMDPEMFVRANELQQLAGQDGVISCNQAVTEGPETGNPNSKWRWSWPF